MSQKPPPDLQDLFAAALGRHQAGHLGEAETLYRQILQREPRHDQSLHLQGVLAHQRGRDDRAVCWIRRAIAITANAPIFHANLGVALKNLGRLTEAVTAFDVALCLTPTDAETHFNRGATLHRAARFSEAAAAFTVALCLAPDHAEAHYNRGAMLNGLEHGSEAVAAYGAALRLKPDFIAARDGLATALRELQRCHDSVATLRTLLSLAPDHASAQQNLGLALNALGRREEAKAAYRRALVCQPDFTEAHANLGVAHRDLGAASDAIACLRTAVSLAPDLADALCNLGVALNDAARREAALACYRGALGVKPVLVQAHYNRGIALHDLGRAEDAIAAYRTALCVMPDHAEAHCNLGGILTEQRCLDQAVARTAAALRIRPAYPEAHSNLGIALKQLGRLEEAVAAFDRALAERPDYAEAHSNRGLTLHDLGRIDGALSAYRAALRLDPDYAEAHYNEAFSHLLRGNLAAGWPKYEWRWRGGNKTLLPRGFRQPQWRGEDITGRTILLHAEQGAGDTIQFCRFAALVAARGALVVLEVPRSLMRLLASLPGVFRLVACGDPLPDFDLHCPLMSLPLAFATTVGTIPAQIPYLAAEPGRVLAWRDRLPTAALLIGIVWQGSPDYHGDRNRSFALAGLAPLAKIAGVRLISLQKMHGLAQLEDLPPGMTVQDLGPDFDAGPDGFLDAAAVMINLDLIITADTAIGHLAGALGRPVWLPLAAIPHWVWMLDRDDTPWYPRTRLFRQKTSGDWQAVFERMAAEIARMQEADRPIFS